MEEKDLVHIVKVSDDTFAQSEIIPLFGIMLPVPGMFHMCLPAVGRFLVLYLLFKTIVKYVVKAYQ